MILKKTVVVNRPSIIQARHLFFNWKQETRRELPPSAPLVFRKQETKGRSYDSTSSVIVRP